MIAPAVQVERKTGTTHTITWLDAALKLELGIVLSAKVIRARGQSYTYTFSWREK
jgi:hypothetical protein